MSAFRRNFTMVTFAAWMLMSGCSDSATGPATSSVNENTLVFTRADQSRIVFPTGAQLSVWCGPWEAGTTPTPAVHIVFAPSGTAGPAWSLTAVIADVKIGVPLTFPNTYVFDQPKNADLFILDSSNELSTFQAQSSGSITFQQLNCASGGRVQFSIAAVVGSEFGGGPSVSVAGRLNAPVGLNTGGVR